MYFNCGIFKDIDCRWIYLNLEFSCLNNDKIFIVLCLICF